MPCEVVSLATMRVSRHQTQSPSYTWLEQRGHTLQAWGMGIEGTLSREGSS